MRFCVITTTINVPKVMELYASIDPDVQVIITGDKKTPSDDVRRQFGSMENVIYLDVDQQVALNYRCSETIGWNTIQRRNIAILEAIRQQADVIVTVDDDNYPVDRDYFQSFKRIFSDNFHGLAGETHDGWFDIGQIFEPSFHHRGFPYDIRDSASEITLSPIVGAKIGVAAGLWLGDPDIDAATRLVNKPVVKRIGDLATAGIVVRPTTWTVFNSQNTAFRNSLAPLMMVWPQMGRYDDIWASYAAQRVMREDGWCVHFGRPFVWQQRNPQRIINNLEHEIFGMKMTGRFIDDLDGMELRGSTLLDRFKSLFEALQTLQYVPETTIRTGLNWCEDVYDLLSQQT